MDQPIEPHATYRHSQETKDKIRASLVGRKSPSQFQKGHKINVGRPVIVTEAARLKMSIAKKGKPLSVAHRIALSSVRSRGEKHHWWKGGVTSISAQIRSSFPYKLWRKAVFERDNYTCQECGDSSGGNLQADHIKPFAYFPELRFVLSNGRTLCKECHKKTSTWGYKATLLYGN